MDNLIFNIAMTEEDSIMFAKCIDKLNRSSFIVGDKDDKLYSFATRESNRLNISAYLRLSGWDIEIDEEVKVIHKLPRTDNDFDITAKKGNIVTFTSTEQHLLLLLWDEYLGSFCINENNIITKGELVDKMNAFDIKMDAIRLSKALEVFKRYDLIDCDLDNNSEDAPVRLYPSLQFGFNIEQFKVISDKYKKNLLGEDDPEENEEDSDDETYPEEYDEEEE